MHFCGIRGRGNQRIEYIDIQGNMKSVRIMRNKRKFILIIADRVGTFPHVPLEISMLSIAQLLTKITQIKFMNNVVLCNVHMLVLPYINPFTVVVARYCQTKRVRDFECTPLLPTGRKSLVRHLCKSRIRIFIF